MEEGGDKPLSKHMKIILFSGKAESGKTTASSMAQKQLEQAGYKVLRLSYGDYVKQTAKMVFGWNGNKDEAGRKLLQWWGTDKVREEHPMFWVNTVTRLADVVQDIFDFAIIDDARYENEIDCWAGYDTYTVRVERLNHENALTPEQREHVSETSLDGYNFNLHLAAEDLEGLEEAVNTILVPYVISFAEKGESA